MEKEKRYYREPFVQIINFQDMGDIFTDMNGTLNGSPDSENFDDMFKEDTLPL